MTIPERLENRICEACPIIDTATDIFLHGMERSWPDWCYLPIDASFAIATYPLPYSLAKLIVGDNRGYNLLLLVSAVVPWRVARPVYRFSAARADEILFAPFERDLSPVALLRNMPAPGVFIELPPDFGCLGIFYFLEFDKRYPGVMELRAHYLFPGDIVKAAFWQFDERGVRSNIFKARRAAEDERAKEEYAKLELEYKDTFEHLLIPWNQPAEPEQPEISAVVDGANLHLRLLFYLCQHPQEASGRDGKATIYCIE